MSLALRWMVFVTFYAWLYLVGELFMNPPRIDPEQHRFLGFLPLVVLAGVGATCYYFGQKRAVAALRTMFLMVGLIGCFHLYWRHTAYDRTLSEYVRARVRLDGAREANAERPTDPATQEFLTEREGQYLGARSAFDVESIRQDRPRRSGWVTVALALALLTWTAFGVFAPPHLYEDADLSR